MFDGVKERFTQWRLWQSGFLLLKQPLLELD
jgi:hypothetical protein